MVNNHIYTLTPLQSEYYTICLDSIKRGKTEVVFPPLLRDSSAIEYAKLVLGANPDLIEYNNCKISTISTDESKTVVFERLLDDASSKKYKTEMQDEAGRIVSKIILPQYKTLKRILVIHDYMVENIKYDYEDATGVNINWKSHNAYGAIVDKKAVCEGISYAFTLLCQKAGVHSAVVNGKADGGNHCWNIIRFGKEFYHLDITWDINRYNQCNLRSYDYFCLNDNQMKNREWVKRLYPKCESEQANYFSLSNAWARSYDELLSIMRRQCSEKKRVYVKCDFSFPNEEKAEEYLLNAYKKVILENKTGSISYSYLYNDDQKILSCF